MRKDRDMENCKHWRSHNSDIFLFFITIIYIYISFTLIKLKKKKKKKKRNQITQNCFFFKNHCNIIFIYSFGLQSSYCCFV